MTGAGRRDAGRALWATAAAALVLLAAIVAILWPLQPGALPLQFAHTPRAFAEIVHAWPPEHLRRYRLHLPLDTLLLLCYGAFGWLLAMRGALFATVRPAARRAAAALLPLAAAFDGAENALHWWLTEAPRFGVAPLYLVSATCTALKWLLLLAFALAVIAAAAREVR
ncbi:MAG TPA: hypothetical protein VFZ93_10430 [Albitalea sp.]